MAILPAIRRLRHGSAALCRNTALARRPWAKRADRIKVETLLISKRLFYAVYELGEMEK